MKTYATYKAASAAVHKALAQAGLNPPQASVDYIVRPHRPWRDNAQDYVADGRFLPVVILRPGDAHASDKVALAHAGFRVEDQDHALYWMSEVIRARVGEWV